MIEGHTMNRERITFWFLFFESSPGLTFRDLTPRLDESMPAEMREAARLYCAGLPRPL